MFRPIFCIFPFKFFPFPFFHFHFFLFLCSPFIVHYSFFSFFFVPVVRRFYMFVLVSCRDIWGLELECVASHLTPHKSHSPARIVFGRVVSSMVFSRRVLSRLLMLCRVLIIYSLSLFKRCSRIFLYLPWLLFVSKPHYYHSSCRPLTELRK